MKRMYLLCVILGFILVLPASAQYRRYGYGSIPPPPRQSNRYENQRRFNGNSDLRWYQYNRESYFGLRTGFSLATVHSDDQYLNGGSAMGGLNVGFVAGTQLSSYAPVFFEGGLSYIEKGGKGNYEGKKFTYDLNYLEFPFVFKYKYFVDDQTAVQPYFGGFLSCGVGGQVKDYGQRLATDSFSDDFFRRFDGGLRIGCGLSLQNFYVDMCYDIGISNISHDAFDAAHTGCFMASIGVDL